MVSTSTETTESVTKTMTFTITEDEVPEVKLVDERHVTTIEMSPNFTRPLLPAVEADEGGTVR